MAKGKRSERVKELKTKTQVENTPQPVSQGIPDQKEQLKKLTNIELLLTIISIFAAIVSAISAIISNRQSQKAIDIAQEANQVAADANRLSYDSNTLLQRSIDINLADVRIVWDGNWYQFYQYKYPCFDNSGNIVWSKDLLAIFTIMNVGGRAAYLIELPEAEKINTSVDGLNTEVKFTSLENVEDFDAWMRKNSFDPLDPSYEYLRNSAQVNLPFTVQPGEVRRIVLLEQINTIIDPSLTPEEVSTYVNEYDWITHPIFTFADEIESTLEIVLWAPYIGTPFQGDNTPPYEICENS